jgi:fatty acid desaturase
MTTPTTQQDRPPLIDEPVSEREIARKRVEAKRKVRSDVVAYVIVNAFLIAVWAISGGGYFWPGWVLGGWAVFLLTDAYRVFVSAPITDADIDKEMRQRR